MSAERPDFALASSYSLPDKVRLAWSLLLTWTFFRPARLIRQPTRIRGWANIGIGAGFTTGQFCRIEAGEPVGGRKTLVFGNGIQLNDRCHIAAVLDVRFGDNVLVASNVFVSDHDHGSFSESDVSVIPALRKLVAAPVHIEQDVWLGENSVVLKGVTIGRGSVVAAGAVVTRSVPAYSLVAGVPAVVKRSLNGVFRPQP